MNIQEKNAKEFDKLQKILAKKITSDQDINIFTKNITAIMSINAKLAKLLLNFKENTEFGAFMGKDPLDLNIINQKNLNYMFEHPKDDVTNQIKEFEDKYARYQTLFFYGLGNGIFYRSILANPSHQRIVVFEPELEIIFIVLNLLDFSKEIYNETFILFYTKIIKPTEIYVVSHYDNVFLNIRNYEYHIYNKFYEQDIYKKDVIRINKLITQNMKQCLLECGNDSSDSLIGIKHVLHNIPEIYSNYSLRTIAIKRRKKNRYAIIASTGPSLYKQLDLLKKIEPYALIISIDASYPILKKHGIKPDYVVSLERVEPTSKFFEEKVSKFDDGIIFVVSSLTHQKTIKNLQGRQTCYPFRPLSFEQSLQDRVVGYAGSGPSAAHLAVDLAFWLQVSDIIFIGQDLAFGKDGTSHSKGHIYKSTEIDPETSDIIETAKAYGGKGDVKTTKVWNLFRNYFEHQFAMTKRDGTWCVYNCTEGGARIEGTIEKPFKDLVDEILSNNQLKIITPVDKISPKITEKNIQKVSKKIKTFIKVGLKIQKQCEKIFKTLAKEVEKAKKLKTLGKEDKINYDKLQEISFKVDEFKLNLNDPIFLDVYYGYCGQFLIHQEMEFAQIAVRNVKTEQEKDDKLLEWVSVQGYWLFSLAGSIDTLINAIKDSSKEWLK